MMEQVVHLKKTKPEFEGKVKIAVYMKPKSLDMLKRMAEKSGLPIYKECLELMNDGLKYRKNKQ